MTEHISSTPSNDFKEVRVLTLNNGEHLDGILYRFKKGADFQWFQYIFD